MSLFNSLTQDYLIVTGKVQAPELEIRLKVLVPFVSGVPTAGILID